MKAIIEPLDLVSKKVTIDIEPELCEETKKEVLLQMQKQANVPGFRKGKVPFEFLIQRYSNELESEMKRLLLNRALEFLQKEEKQVLAALSKADFISAKEKGQTLVVEIETVPEVTIPDYKTLILDSLDSSVGDKEVEAFIRQLRKQQASYNVVERPVQEGDYVKVSYRGYYGEIPLDTLSGVPKIWGKQAMTWEEAGVNEAPGVPAIVKGLVDMKAGEKKEIGMQFPDDFPAAELAGKEGRYVVEVHEVREVKLPELNEAFFASHQVKDLEGLKDSVLKTLQERKKQEQMVQQKQRISEYLVENLHCDLPPSWVKSETEKVLQEMVDVFSARGVSDSMLKEQKNAVVQRAKSIAEERIRLNLCLEKIAEVEKIRLEGKDIEPILVQEAMHRQIPVEKVLQAIQKSEVERQGVQRKAMQAKIINFLYQQLLGVQMGQQK